MVVKRSIAKLVRKKLFDITNTQMQPKVCNQAEKPADKNCIEQLLQEKAALMQLVAERDKMIELSGAELLRLRANIEKLQQQNWNLAQSNSQMLAELNLGNEKMKALQHEILCKAALLQGKNSEVKGIEDADNENDGSLLKEGVESAEQPLVKSSNVEKLCDRNRKPTKRSRSTGSVTGSTKDANESKEKKGMRSQPRRRSASFKPHEYEPMMENSSQTQNARTPLNILKSHGEEGEAFGKPPRKTREKDRPYKEIIPPEVKLRRLE
ncbi:shugoshin-1-like isoform X2 [Prosopis cineraria]|uniref:shugoshin-1-like isoform X2 n=1 Tax=Prosopis cineraria TaxID=364024 RepID=UPI00240EB735|nr:shugoshin-1-like isoform X2 [Prosopis cineraria]